MTTYYLLRLGSLVSWVVPLPVAYTLARLVARTVYLLPTRARAATARFRRTAAARAD